MLLLVGRCSVCVLFVIVNVFVRVMVLAFVRCSLFGVIGLVVVLVMCCCSCWCYCSLLLLVVRVRCSCFCYCYVVVVLFWFFVRIMCSCSCSCSLFVVRRSLFVALALVVDRGLCCSSLLVPLVVLVLCYVLPVR